jgi:hypothetical protein
MTTVVAIHQPNFFPWLGYFDKIARSDVFILLDHVQYQKTGGMWSNRVKLLVGGRAQWISAPLDRGFHGVRALNEIEFLPGNPWREKFVKTLVANYARAPYFKPVLEFIEALILNPEPRVARYNTAAIVAICGRLGLATAGFRRSSEIGHEGHANALLISLIKAVGGNDYLCGGGAAGYQDDRQFADAGLRLTYQNFAHPEYRQGAAAPFVPGLSIIDALMYCGFDDVRAALHARVNGP